MDVKLFKDPELNRWFVKFLGYCFLVSFVMTILIFLVHDVKDALVAQDCCKCKCEVLQ